MDVVYLFYEEDRIRIPLFDFDPALFRQLLAFGSWDKTSGQFTLRRRPLSLQQRLAFASRPCVEVGKNGGDAEAAGFFGRPWSGGKTLYILSGADRSCLVSTFPKPEQFSPAWTEKLKAELHSRKYSLKTVSAYVYYNRDFCRAVQKPPEDIAEDDLKKYLASLDAVKDMSSSTMNLALSAVRFFYSKVMGRDFAREQYRPRQDKRLPGVLSRGEINRILESEQNPKHRLLLMLAYSSGLRVSELVALKKKHIDFARKILLVYGAKGRRNASRCST